MLRVEGAEAFAAQTVRCCNGEAAKDENQSCGEFTADACNGVCYAELARAENLSQFSVYHAHGAVSSRSFLFGH